MKRVVKEPVRPVPPRMRIFMDHLFLMLSIEFMLAPHLSQPASVLDWDSPGMYLPDPLAIFSQVRPVPQDRSSAGRDFSALKAISTTPPGRKNSSRPRPLSDGSLLPGSFENNFSA